MTTPTNPEPTFAERMYAYADKPKDATPASPQPSALRTPPTAPPAKLVTTPQRVATPQPEQSLADRVYDNANKPRDATSQPQQGPTAKVAEERSLGDRMYDDLPGLGNPESYDALALRSVFDGLELKARESQDAEEIQAFAQGRKESADLMHEWEVPRDVARGIATELGHWNQRLMTGEPLSDEQVDLLGERSMADLRREWGPQFDKKMQAAQAAAGEAMGRLPWLGQLLETGAGNDKALIKHFARIGERNARAGRGRRKS